MNKCFIVLAVLSLAFHAGSAIRCYNCLSCGNPSAEIEFDCLPQFDYCFKYDEDDGTVIHKGCSGKIDLGLGAVRIEGLPNNASLAGKDGKALNNIALVVCNTGNLCNGSNRLAEVSTMMILVPASLVLLISALSR